MQAPNGFLVFHPKGALQLEDRPHQPWIKLDHYSRLFFFIVTHFLNFEESGHFFTFFTNLDDLFEF